MVAENLVVGFEHSFSVVAAAVAVFVQLVANARYGSEIICKALHHVLARFEINPPKYVH